MFKKRRGIHIPYNKQGLIYFTCMDVKNQPPEMQDKILNLCMSVGEEDWQALYELVTDSTQSVTALALKYFINEKRLYKLRKEFYESW
ncbi:MAG: hypothetical protein IIX18_02995 [Clostridia bacterium]|nr:hypothetical protein [Clostridia bacterium]